MRIITYWLYAFLGIILSATAGMAQNKYTISGYVKDIESGETLIGVNVFLEDDVTTGTVSNTYGFYSLTLPERAYKIVFSYLGYQNFVSEIDLKENMTFNIDLQEGWKEHILFN